ncbi:uncharacterized protein LOC124450917 [Xenia sp. Carnegie-2017]|uniref:uncharacterized protein LOC124450917 n=1 Tax=Xenia sp. Carnegie-2017 TaxID=2897299 RepID=UPI001F04AF89|nr:uncharacterized protein LOC124450917 [Xenia sp. Carnegie-2017]
MILSSITMRYNLTCLSLWPTRKVVIVMNTIQYNSSSSESEDKYIHRIGNVEWCECGFCVVMSTGRESICFQEVNNTDPLIHGDHICITQEEEFATVCTNEAVLKTAMVVYTHDIGPMPESEENEALRYTAYRQWHGLVDGLVALSLSDSSFSLNSFEH